MQRVQVAIEKRNVLGKQVKALRNSGLLPINIYGKGLKSLAGQMPTKAFKVLYKQVHETGLVDIKIDKETLPTLIQHVQYDPATQEIIHANFYKVDLKEKIKANIPIVQIGEAPAEQDKKGILLQLLSEMEVEALPTDLPEHIEVSVENLKELDEQVAVSQISAPTGVTILNDPELIIFKIGELAKEEPVEVAPAEEGLPAEGEPGGETPAEGVTPQPQEGKKEE